MHTDCKQRHWPHDRGAQQCRFRSRWVRATLVLSLTATVALAGCRLAERTKLVSVHELEASGVVLPEQTQRTLVTNPQLVDDIGRPLGPRMALVTANDPDEWARLKRLAPGLGPCPDFKRGMVVGLVSRAGTPVDGAWPLRVKSVRLHAGAGYVIGQFHAGSYLADNAAYLETAYFPDLEAVLVVEINGLRYLARRDPAAQS